MKLSKNIFFLYCFFEDCFFSREQKLKWKFKLKSKQKNINKINNNNTNNTICIWNPMVAIAIFSCKRMQFISRVSSICRSWSQCECLHFSRESLTYFLILVSNTMIPTCLASLLLSSRSWSRVDYIAVTLSSV